MMDGEPLKNGLLTAEEASLNLFCPLTDADMDDNSVDQITLPNAMSENCNSESVLDGETAKVQLQKSTSSLPLADNSICNITNGKVDTENSSKNNLCQAIQKPVNGLSKKLVTESTIKIKTESNTTAECNGESSTGSDSGAQTDKLSFLNNRLNVISSEVKQNDMNQTPSEMPAKAPVENLVSVYEELDSLDKELDSLLGCDSQTTVVPAASSSNSASNEIIADDATPDKVDNTIFLNLDSGNIIDNTGKCIASPDIRNKIKTEKPDHPSCFGDSSNQLSRPANDSEMGLLNVEESNLPNHLTKTFKRGAELSNTSQPAKKPKNVDDTDSTRSTNMTIVRNVESPLSTKQARLNRMSNKLDQYLNKYKSPDEIKQIRENLCQKFIHQESRTPITMAECEELLIMKVAELFAVKSDVGQVRQKGKFIENEQHRLLRLYNNMRKQVDDMKIIVRKIIDEKNSGQAWTNGIIPMKVTRSVGLQVCTVGPITMVTPTSKERGNMPWLTDALQNRTSNSEQRNVRSIPTSRPTSSDPDSDDLVFVGEQPPSSSDSTNRRRFMINRNTPSKAGSSHQPVIPTTPTVTSPGQHTVGTPIKKTQLPATIDLTDNEEESTSAATSGQLARRNQKQPSADSEQSTSKSQNPPAKPNGASGPVGVIKETPEQGLPNIASAYAHLPMFPPTIKYTPDVVRPPRPIIRIGRNNQGKEGIMLSWSFDPKVKDVSNIMEYQLFACQENLGGETHRLDPWKKVGDIKALPLPMACFLTQFVPGNKYHFIVRAISNQKIQGDFSLPGSIILRSSTTTDVPVPKTK